MGVIEFLIQKEKLLAKVTKTYAKEAYKVDNLLIVRWEWYDNDGDKITELSFHQITSEGFFDFYPEKMY